MQIGIFIASISIIICIIFCIFLSTRVKKKNKEIEKYNEELNSDNENLTNQKNELIKDVRYYTTRANDERDAWLKISNDIEIANASYNNIKEKEQEARERINEINKSAGKVAETQKELALAAFEEYQKNLEEQKRQLENTFKEYEELLRNAYNSKQSELLKETDTISKELENAKIAKAALIEAARREQEIKDNSSFYCIEVSAEDLTDIAKLETVKKTLLKPRILSMLIWQTYYQKPLKTLTAKILGAKATTGIYKITNIITGECYIGQAVNY